MAELTRRWRLKRPVFLAGAALGAVLVASVLLLPLAVSSDLVRDRLERDIGNWAGHPVSLGNAPSLSFWPLPTIKLDNVEIRPSVYADGDPIMRAESIIANFNLFSAVLGAPSFSEYRLIRPTFALEIYPDGSSNWAARDGALLQGIQAAVALDTAAVSGAAPPASVEIPDSAALGTVTIVDGTVNWVRDPGAPAEKVTAVNGTISWTGPTSEATANLSAIVRGEQMKVTLSSDTPLLLLGQRTADMALDVASAPLTLDFDGEINLSPKGFVKGALKLKSPSVRRTLEWSGADIKPGEAIGALDLAADVTASERMAKLDNLILVIDQNRGIGVLDVALPLGEPPTIAGTLAFNTLDIASFLQAFTPLPKTGDEIASKIDTRFLREIGLDLRLSAQSAKLGPLQLSNLAAAARIVAGRATFDVGDATAYGGSLSGRIAISEAGIDGGAKLQVAARDTDFGKLFDAIGLTGPLPRGTGALDLELTTPYPTWATATSDLTGKFSMSVAKGTIPGFNLTKFRTLATSQRFFLLSDTATSTPFFFQTARFEAGISGGQAVIRLAEVSDDKSTISLSGIVPYLRGGLAVAGTVQAKLPDATTSPAAAPAAKPAETPLRFFAGGSWPQPVISPVED